MKLIVNKGWSLYKEEKKAAAIRVAAINTPSESLIEEPHTDEEVNFELNAILARESRIPWWQMVTLGCLEIGMLIFLFLKGGASSTTLGFIRHLIKRWSDNSRMRNCRLLAPCSSDYSLFGRFHLLCWHSPSQKTSTKSCGELPFLGIKISKKIVNFCRKKTFYGLIEELSFCRLFS